MLQFFSASNGSINSRKAMSEAIHHALATESSLDCDLIIFHCAMGHEFTDLLDEAKKLCPRAEIVGCTSGGVIGTEGADESMKALAIMAIKGPPSEFAIAFRNDIRNQDSFKVARDLALELRQKNPQVNMVMALASGLDIVADQAIKGIESSLGKIPIFGGTSFDNMKAISNRQFVGTEVLERGLVLVGFADPTLEIKMRAHHGNAPLGLPFTVTKSEGHRVDEIEHQAAWPYLMEKLGLPIETHPGQTIPFAGLAEVLSEKDAVDYDSNYIMRLIVRTDDDHMSFFMPTTCPVGTQLWLTRRDEQLIFDGLNQMLSRLCDEVGDRDIVAVFHTDCAARGKVMFNRLVKDEFVNKMQTPFCKPWDKAESKAHRKAVPWLGMYGLGEFTQLNGRNRFHNYTTSIYALTRKV